MTINQAPINPIGQVKIQSKASRVSSYTMNTSPLRRYNNLFPKQHHNPLIKTQHNPLHRIRRPPLLPPPPQSSLPTLPRRRRTRAADAAADQLRIAPGIGRVVVGVGVRGALTRAEEGRGGRSGALVAAPQGVVAGWAWGWVRADLARREERDVAPRDDGAGAGTG